MITVTLEVNGSPITYKGSLALVNALSDDAEWFDGKGIVTISDEPMISLKEEHLLECANGSL
jgi:hypothetical protein